MVHLSEVANILEAKSNLQTALDFLEELLTAKNVKILPVTTEDYLKAVLIAREKNISANDALAYLKMKELGIKEIYTFDRHFEGGYQGLIHSSSLAKGLISRRRFLRGCHPKGRGFQKKM
ncbi:PIN domain-containing protein [Pyrococcus sp. NA2]|uniref:PIN domain-containing protein n=1 Tax=Pyrococcus sp. (strain NA2) TaxID=342949 RepID=UPI0035256823